MSGGATQTTQQDAGPSKIQRPYLNDIFSQAANLYNSAPPQLYGGNWTAGFTAPEQQAQQGALSYAGGAGGDFAKNVTNAGNFALGDVLKADSNPYLSGYAEGAIRPITQNLTRSVLPGISTDASAAGASGSTRQGIAEGLAIQGAQQQAGDITSNIYSNAYNSGLNTFNQALGNAGNIYNTGLMPTGTQAAVGAQQREMDQAGIDQKVREYEYQQQLPYLMLQQYLGFVSGDYGSSGSSFTSRPQNLFERLFGSSLF